MKQYDAAAERIIKMENIQPLDVEQLLAQRELHKQRCASLQQEQPLPLLCFSLDIHRSLQHGPLARFVFDNGKDRLLAQLGQPKALQLYRDDDGGRLYMLYEQEEETLQECCHALAAVTPLWQLELVSRDGRFLYQPRPRLCRVCGGESSLCRRSRAHSEAEIIAADQELLEQFAAEWLAQQAVEAHLEQLRLSPKPGLPDINNNGAAAQADQQLLQSSAAGLKDYFYRCVRWGLAEEQPLSSLQELGLAAEAHSLSADGHTLHRAVIYLFALLLAAQGSSLARGGDIFDLAAGLARQGELPAGDEGVASGRKSYLPGARQEAEAAFPLARWGCELLMKQQETALTVLLNMISKCHDSRVLEQHGMETLQLLQQKAASILNKPAFARKALAQRLDKQLIEQNVRPGGAAALLSCALFLQRSAMLWQPQE